MCETTTRLDLGWDVSVARRLSALASDLCLGVAGLVVGASATTHQRGGFPIAQIASWRSALNPVVRGGFLGIAHVCFMSCGHEICCLETSAEVNSGIRNRKFSEEEESVRDALRQIGECPTHVWARVCVSSGGREGD
ncbi:unnamed protein product [Lota lota]